MSLSGAEPMVTATPTRQARARPGVHAIEHSKFAWLTLHFPGLRHRTGYAPWSG